MSLETDLAGEQEPEERMELHEQLNDPDDTNYSAERGEAEAPDSRRSSGKIPPEADAHGSETTEDFDIKEALTEL